MSCSGGLGFRSGAVTRVLVLAEVCAQQQTGGRSSHHAEPRRGLSCFVVWFVCYRQQPQPRQGRHA